LHIDIFESGLMGCKCDLEDVSGIERMQVVQVALTALDLPAELALMYTVLNKDSMTIKIDIKEVGKQFKDRSDG